MTRKLTITYDRRDALFHIIEDTEHGGVAEYHCAFLSAVATVAVFANDAQPLNGSHSMCGSLQDGRLTSITLEAP